MRKTRIIYLAPLILVIVGAYMLFCAHQLNTELDRYGRSMLWFVYKEEYWPKVLAWRRYKVGAYVCFYIASLVSWLLLAYNWNKSMAKDK